MSQHLKCWDKNNKSTSAFELLYPWARLSKLGYDNWWVYDNIHPASEIFRVPSGEFASNFKSLSPKHKKKVKSNGTTSKNGSHFYIEKLKKNICEVDSSKDDHDQNEIKVQDKHLKKEFGLLRHKIIPDGNCLYRAIAQALVHDQSKHMIMRHEAIEHIRENKKEFEKVIEGDVDCFLDEAQKEGVWASYAEILALSRLLDINIIIVTGGSASNPKVHVTCHHFEPDNQTPLPRDTLWLSWLSNGHYDVILNKKMDNPEYLKWKKCKNTQIEADEMLALKLSRRSSVDSEEELCNSVASSKISDYNLKESIRMQTENDEILARKLQQEEEDEADFEDLYA